MKLKYKKLYKSVLKEYQQFSKCARLKVAALLVNDGRILCCGYNGTPAGQVNCNELFKVEDGCHYLRSSIDENWQAVTEADWKEMHHEFAEKNEIHAEMNCIAQGFRHGINVENTDLVISLQPCDNCAKLIVASGIKNVYFVDTYDRNSNSINYLTSNGVSVEQI